MREILGAALELAPDQRPGFLDQSCGSDRDLRHEVEALLAITSDDGFIDEPAIADGVALLDQNDAQAMVGRTIGRYRILELIGEGGVGAVYRAVREDDGDFEHHIALKLLKRGMYGRAKFDLLRQRMLEVA